MKFNEVAEQLVSGKKEYVTGALPNGEVLSTSMQKDNVELKERISVMWSICDDLAVRKTGILKNPDGGPGKGVIINNFKLFEVFLDDFDELPDDNKVKLVYARLFAYMMNLTMVTNSLCRNVDVTPMDHKISKEEINSLMDKLTKGGDE